MQASDDNYDKFDWNVPVSILLSLVHDGNPLKTVRCIPVYVSIIKRYQQ